MCPPEIAIYPEGTVDGDLVIAMISLNKTAILPTLLPQDVVG
jgi:hypothetical protein